LLHFARGFTLFSISDVVCFAFTTVTSYCVCAVSIAGTSAAWPTAFVYVHTSVVDRLVSKLTRSTEESTDGVRTDFVGTTVGVQAFVDVCASLAIA